MPAGKEEWTCGICRFFWYKSNYPREPDDAGCGEPNQDCTEDGKERWELVTKERA